VIQEPPDVTRRKAQFHDPPFDRRRFFLFPASWPFIDEFGCVLWIDPEWRVLGASEILFFNVYPTADPVSRTEITPYAQTPSGPFEIEHVHIMIPSRTFYRTLPFHCRMRSGARATLWFHEHDLPAFKKEIPP
jgi:hypothetical protein